MSSRRGQIEAPRKPLPAVNKQMKSTLLQLYILMRLDTPAVAKLTNSQSNSILRRQ